MKESDVISYHFPQHFHRKGGAKCSLVVLCLLVFGLLDSILLCLYNFSLHDGNITYRVGCHRHYYILCVYVQAHLFQCKWAGLIRCHSAPCVERRATRIIGVLIREFWSVVPYFGAFVEVLSCRWACQPHQRRARGTLGLVVFVALGGSDALDFNTFLFQGSVVVTAFFTSLY